MESIKHMDDQIVNQKKVIATMQKNLDTILKNKKTLQDELDYVRSGVDDVEIKDNKQPARMTTQEFVKWKTNHENIKKLN